MSPKEHRAVELVPAGTPDVLVGRHGRLGMIRLNRPRAINALTTPMVLAVTAALRDLERTGRVTSVLLDGAGDRGLCAGGDVVAVRRSVLAGDGAAAEFFAAEYAMDAAIATSALPVTAWMDGIVMGGGVGVSVHAGLRLVTERTRLAMPETAIGFFPDVGALWWLARCPGESGTRLALTGAHVTGTEAVGLGLADRLVPSSALPELLDRAADGEDLAGAGRGDGQLEDAELEDGGSGDGRPQHRGLGDGGPAGIGRDDALEPLLAGSDPRTIRDRLRASTHPAALAAAAELDARSPFAVAVTLTALRRAARLSTVSDVLEQDRRLAPRVAARPDFTEGVRAQLVDKDRSPRWEHRDLAQVDPADVERMFD